MYAKLFLNTIINGKSQTLLSDFFFEGRGGCTQAKTQRTNKKDDRFCSHYIKVIHVLQDIIFVLASNAVHFRNLKMFG